MYYIISLCLFLLIYVLAVLFIHKCRNTIITNIVLVAITFFCYVALVIIVYKDVGYKDWNFQNTLPTANVSPFMFCTLIIYVFLPKKAQKVWSRLISLLSLGMIVAVVIACISRAVIDYKFHFQFVLDYVSHLSLSILGVYLVKSNQVDLKVKDCLISGSLIVAVAVIMLVINAIAGTAFFGLALNEKYNIYNMVIVNNCYLSAFIYFVGLIFVLVAGYFYLRIITFKKKKTDI